MKFTKYTKELEQILNDAITHNFSESAYICFSGKIEEYIWYKKVFHKILKWLDKSWITHVSIVFKDKNNKWLCLESTYPVTQINDFGWFKLPYHQGQIYKLMEIEQREHLEIIRKLCKKYLGKKYGIWQLIGAFFVRIGLTWFNWFNRDDKIQVCSELGYYYFIQSKYKYLMHGLKPNLISPQQLKTSLSSLYNHVPRKMLLVKEIGFDKK